MDAEPVTEAQARAARRAYYGAIAYIDDQLGRLMEALRSVALAEDTIVILTSDHGEMLGERGLWYKMSFFEGASRVPLVVASPGRFEPRRVAASVSLVDLMPTLIDLAGGNAQSPGIGVDGRSLAPHLRGAGGHDEAIGEYLAEGAIAPIVMIRRGAYKFIHSPVDPDQLFDLNRDPRERDNLADDPSCAGGRRRFSRGSWETLGLGRTGWRGSAIASADADSSTPRSARARSTPGISSRSMNASRQYVRNSIDLDDLETNARAFRLPRAAEIGQQELGGRATSPLLGRSRDKAFERRRWRSRSAR